MYPPQLLDDFFKFDQHVAEKIMMSAGQQPQCLPTEYDSYAPQPVSPGIPFDYIEPDCMPFIKASSPNLIGFNSAQSSMPMFFNELENVTDLSVIEPSSPRVFINHIDNDFGTDEFSVDSGMSSGLDSGQSSPGPLSPVTVHPPTAVGTPALVYQLVQVPFVYLVNWSPPPVEQVQPLEEPQVLIPPNHPHRIPRINNIPVTRLIKWSLPPPLAPQVPLPGWKKMAYDMQEFWQSGFAHFFLPFWANSGHVWTFQPVSSAPESDEWMWHTCSYTAKVRFICERNHGFTMLKGRVNFYYRIRREGDSIVCEAQFQLFGAQCNRCNHSKPVWLEALWYHAEIENALLLLSMEVAKTYYGGEKLPPPRRVRGGRPNPSRHHDTARCQACHEGLCVARR